MYVSYAHRQFETRVTRCLYGKGLCTQGHCLRLPACVMRLLVVSQVPLFILFLHTCAVLKWSLACAAVMLACCNKLFTYLR